MSEDGSENVVAGQSWGAWAINIPAVEADGMGRASDGGDANRHRGVEVMVAGPGYPKLTEAAKVAMKHPSARKEKIFQRALARGSS